MCQNAAPRVIVAVFNQQESKSLFRCQYKAVTPHSILLVKWVGKKDTGPLKDASCCFLSLLYFYRELIKYICSFFLMRANLRSFQILSSYPVTHLF